MAPIYSFMGIEKDKLSEEFETILDTGEILKYTVNYPEKYVINMPYIGQGKSKGNKCGWLRNKTYFFERLLEEHPTLFSEENKLQILEGESPIVDKTFVDYFPEYSNFIGEKLIHHHIGEDGQAIALPTSLHKGYGVVHNSEKVIGITENGINFSEIIQKEFIEGKVFDWDNADQIMDRVLINNLVSDIPNENNFSEEIDKKFGFTQENRAITDGVLKKVKFNKFIKKIEIKHVVLIGGVLVTGTVIAVAAKKAGGFRNLAQKIGKVFRKTLKANEDKIGSLNIAKDTQVIDKIPEIISVFSEKSEVFKDGMDEVSVFRPIFLQFKEGSIDKEELIQKAQEISKVTGKNFRKYLIFLKNRHIDEDAIRALF